ncbi:sensor domain-containing diguanylate cyclase [Bacillus sp. Hm123]|uniref:sensor domain-containing diguanylate cyclase n=1 Tax=Bacillus sp. Hm123 TaxID=3450745 RepID=UPI003F440B21
MDSNDKVEWLVNYKAMLFQLIIQSQKSLITPDQLVQEWLDLVRLLFKTDQLALYRGERLYSGWIDVEKIANEEYDTIYQAFTVPFLKGRNLPKKGNLSFQLSDGSELYLFLQVPEELLEEFTDEQLSSFVQATNEFITFIKQMNFGTNNEKRYKELFNVTEKFHSSLDIEYVLGEILSTLERVFPQYTYHFLLAIDDRYKELPTEHFNFERASEEAMSAYINGKVQLEQRPGRKASILYAPLMGKQGVYGVLQVKIPAERQILESEKDFIRILANTGGSAIEKAKLYEQSRKLIADLQLINATSHQLNSTFRFTDTTQYLNDQIARFFQASAVGFMFIDDEKMEILPGSSRFFYEHEGQRYIDYAWKRIQKEKDSFFVGELAGKLEEHLPYHSLMVVPMVHGSVLKGFCIVLKQEAYGFTFDMYKLLQSLIHHSTLGLTNAMLREELEKLVITDHLTKLFSRNYLDRSISESIAQDEEGTFLLIDIDDFKAVNDTYGHQTGDETIIQVANLIRKTTGENDIAARWGGEELALYFPEKSLEEGVVIAEKLVESVAHSTNPRVTISCGVAYWSKEQTSSVKVLFNQADEALYKAKKTGKNKVIICSNDQ